MQRGSRTPPRPEPPTERRATLSDGTEVLIRPLCPEDAPVLAAGLAKLSAASRRSRFLTDVDHLTPQQLHYLTHPDGIDHLALGMELAEHPADHHEGVGVARCIRSPFRPDVGEVAVAIVDDYQGKRAGSVLLTDLAAWSRQAGMKRWCATMFISNHRVRKALAHIGAEVLCKVDAPGVLYAEYAL